MNESQVRLEQPCRRKNVMKECNSTQPLSPVLVYTLKRCAGASSAVSAMAFGVDVRKVRNKFRDGRSDET